MPQCEQERASADAEEGDSAVGDTMTDTTTDSTVSSTATDVAETIATDAGDAMECDGSDETCAGAGLESAAGDDGTL